MIVRTPETPTIYQQRDSNLGARNMIVQPDATLEEVSYVENSHIRFWYNFQTEDYAPHYHDAMELVICMENRYMAVVDNEIYDLDEGDMLFIPPYAMHELLCPGDGIRFVCLIDINMLKEFADFRLMKPVFQKPFFCNEKLCPDIYQDIYSLFRRMIDIYFSENISWEARIYSQLFEALSQINDFYIKKHALLAPDSELRVGQARYGKISSALYFIDNNFTNDISLEDAADYIGFSKYHFSRLFKSYTNSTFYDYLCRRRIQKAQSLLTTTMSVTDIAFQVGFNNITTFSRCFRKYAGCSPSEYRKKHSKE